jgi:glycosyltransferase involved in cell wall biosynthesis
MQEVMKEDDGNVSNHPKIIICIPAYNVAKDIEDVIMKAKNYADEVVVCDDGSYDDTSKVARDAGAIVIRHSKNQGYGKAVRTLFRTALERKADVIVTLDSDGQHNAEQIPFVLEPILKDGFDIVIGSRFMDYNDKMKVPFYRSIGIKAITKLTNHGSFKNLTDAQSGFRGYSRHALERINLVQDGMSISTEILLSAGTKNLTIKEVPITINYDVNRSSTHNFLSHGIGVLFSVLQFISLRHPLIFYGLPGIASLIVSGIFAYSSLELFSATRFISINLILLSITTAIIGIVLLTTGSILFTIAAMLTNRAERSVLFSLLQFISLRHPLIFYGLPGIASLIVSGIFAFNALDYFSSWRYVTSQLTNMLFVMVGTAIIGIVLLTAGSMLFSITAMLKGRIRLD